MMPAASSESAPADPAPPPSWRATLARFSRAAWDADPGGATAQVAFSLVRGGAPAAILWAGGGLVNALVRILAVPGHPPAPALPWVATLALLAVIANAAETCEQFIVARLRPLIALRQERAFLEAAAQMPLLRFEHPETYDLMTRSRAAFGHRLTNVVMILITIGRLAATLLAYGLLLWHVYYLLALVVVLPAIPSVWLKVRESRSRYVHDYDAAPARRMMSYLFGLLLGPASGQEVRVFGLFEPLMERWRAAHGRWRAESRAQAWTETGAAVGTSLAEVAAYAAAIAILAARIAGRRLDLGAYVVLTGAAAAFQGSLETLLHQVRDMMQDVPLLQDLYGFLDAAAAARAAAGTRPFPAPLHEGLEVAGLRFRYPGSDREALSGVSFRARPGETLAIVGANGAGKSTLVKLILGLYRPDDGSARYDGVDIQAIAPASRARHCAAVFQDFARFRRPAREEIAPGKPELQAQDAALWEALAAAGVEPRFRDLPGGLDTFLDPSLGETGGIELSGGEWQKLAIARAIASGPQVLVLDEPAAALDPEAEVELYRQFARLSQGRITFLVSHRMGSARLADRILVLDGGRIVEEGSHDALLARQGLYARYFQAQAQWYQAKLPQEEAPHA